MDQAFIDHQKERLLTLKAELEHELQRARENLQEGFAPSEVKDQEEVAVINNMRQLDIAGGILFEDRIYEIDQALKAIDTGTYGICERCGRPINPERLEAKPWALLCIQCQEELDAAS